MVRLSLVVPANVKLNPEGGLQSTDLRPESSAAEAENVTDAPGKPRLVYTVSERVAPDPDVDPGHVMDGELKSSTITLK